MSQHVMTRGGSGITRHFRFTSGLDVKPPRHVTTSKIGGTPTSSDEELRGRLRVVRGQRVEGRTARDGARKD